MVKAVVEGAGGNMEVSIRVKKNHEVTLTPPRGIKMG